MLILIVVALAAGWGLVLQALINLQDKELDRAEELKFFPICENSSLPRNDGKNERG